MVMGKHRMLELRERLDFSADEFAKLPRRERADICILLAERAQEMAMQAQSVERLILVNIASQWLHLGPSCSAATSN